MTKICLIIFFSLYLAAVFNSCQKVKQSDTLRVEETLSFDINKDIIYISNYRELKIIASTVNYGNDLFGKTIVLLNDIECGIDDMFEGIGYYNTKHDNAPFRGKIDGNNKTIKNLNIKKPSESNIGFIKYMTHGATIKNLTITGTIEGYENVGSFVGLTEGCVTIANSINNAYVKAEKYGGGIVGMSLELDGKSSEIIKAENSGRIKSSLYAGAIIGYGEKILLSEAKNNGVIHCKNEIKNNGMIGFEKECIINCILNENHIENEYPASKHKD